MTAEMPAEKWWHNVTVHTHKMPVSLTLRLDEFPPDVRDMFQQHLEHDTIAENSILGWLSVHCRTCDTDLWKRSTT
ncbi:hypothetical protein ACFYUR_18645 [Micromonospora haikouensis]|uniref:hypothetical protein n=1 Tax=Micromonospora haikouensis TaxID=686309 RepID=UPI0036CA4C84